MSEKKIPFRTILDKHIITYTPAGKAIIEQHARKIDNDGNVEFYVCGKTNILEKIQAYEPETNIENILRACTETGDMSYLERTKGMYADISEFPANIFEAHQKIENAKETFKNLPLEIKEKYDHSFEKFIKDFGTENWIKNMQIDTTKKETPKELKEETVNE